jgi:hypothetical protein
MSIDESDAEKRVIDKLPAGELRPDDRGQDEVREAFEEGLAEGESRPLTREEREAAEHDPGPAKTVYAPASERVPKAPAPGDEQFVHRQAAPPETPPAPDAKP